MGVKVDAKVSYAHIVKWGYTDGKSLDLPREHHKQRIRLNANNKALN
jgi:hypothetical protein